MTGARVDRATPRAAALAAIAAIWLAVAGSGCLPTNNIGTSLLSSVSTGTGLGSGLGSSASDDGARAPCTQYDTSSPTRGICRGCYNSVLAANCPGKPTIQKDFSLCVDRTIRENYVGLINQCMAQTISAGFTCNLTCASGLVVNPSTCTCVAPASGAGGFGGPQFIDVGQQNFGPPVVTAAFPAAGAFGVPTASSCEGTLPVALSVTNRGDTIFRLNQYGAPAIATSANQETVPKNYLQSASTPVSVDPETTAQLGGSNTLTAVKFRTGAQGEIVATAFGTASFIKTVSGASSTGESASGHLVPAADATWASPGFGARDLDGNLYFSDTQSHVVKVICYRPNLGSPHCAGVTAGHIKLLAGKENEPGKTGHAVVGTAAYLNSPHGLAVDQYYNVYIADSANHAVRVYCGNTAGASPCGAAGLGTTGRIYTVAGTLGVSGGVGTTDLNYPYGLDVVTNGGAFNIYIADYQNHAVRAWCGFVSSSGCPSSGTIGAPVIHTLVGTGTAGLVDPGALAGQLANNPTDVKINWNGNLVYADHRNHLVRAICYAYQAGTALNPARDFCSAAGAAGLPKVINLAGKTVTEGGVPKPVPGDLGNGALGTQSTITLPYQLAIAKHASDDVTSSSTNASATGAGTPIVTSPLFPNFRDNNILFTEKLRPGSQLKGQSEPTPIGAPNGNNSSNVSAISMGLQHTCFTTGGAVKCVGNNSLKQMGNATAGSIQPAPLDVTGLTAGRGLTASGVAHSCSVLSGGGGLKCWGNNDKGQLGDGTVGGPSGPIDPDTTGSSANFKGIAAGANHSCAIDSSNRVLCWGYNAFGQLGNSTFVDEPAMVQASSAAGIVYLAVTAGYNHSCVVAQDTGPAPDTYSIRCFGAAVMNGSATNENSPQVAYVDPDDDESNFIALRAGANHTCVIRYNGHVACWGSNASGELGAGTSGDPQSSSPGDAAGITTATKLALGESHTCALVSASKVQCWGSNLAGQLGNDDVPGSTVPIDVVGLPSGTITDIAAAGNQTCALVDAVPYCWGDNQQFQLGNKFSNTPASGNVLRILCGDNTSYAGKGFCKGVSVANTLFTLAGSPGKVGDRNAGQGSFAQGALFAKIQGVTYDFYRNIVVSSGGLVTQSGPKADFSLRRILNESAGTVSAAKYSFTDNNSQSSYYCLRFKPLTACDSDGTCGCRVAPPTDEIDTSFWSARSQTQSCN